MSSQQGDEVEYGSKYRHKRMHRMSGTRPVSSISTTQSLCASLMFGKSAHRSEDRCKPQRKQKHRFSDRIERIASILYGSTLLFISLLLLVLAAASRACRGPTAALIFLCLTSGSLRARSLFQLRYTMAPMMHATPTSTLYAKPVQPGWRQLTVDTDVPEQPRNIACLKHPSFAVDSRTRKIRGETQAATVYAGYNMTLFEWIHQDRSSLASLCNPLFPVHVGMANSLRSGAVDRTTKVEAQEDRSVHRQRERSVQVFLFLGQVHEATQARNKQEQRGGTSRDNKPTPLLRENSPMEAQSHVDYQWQIVEGGGGDCGRTTVVRSLVVQSDVGIGALGREEEKERGQRGTSSDMLLQPRGNISGSVIRDELIQCAQSTGVTPVSVFERQLSFVLGQLTDPDAPILFLTVGSDHRRSIGFDRLPRQTGDSESEMTTAATAEPGSDTRKEDTLRAAAAVGAELEPSSNRWYAGKQYDLDMEYVRSVLDDWVPTTDALEGDTDDRSVPAYRIAGIFLSTSDEDDSPADSTGDYGTSLARYVRRLRQDLNADGAPFVLSTPRYGQGKDGGVASTRAETARALDRLKRDGDIPNFDTVSVGRSHVARPTTAGTPSGDLEEAWAIGNAMGWTMGRLVLRARPTSSVA